MQRFIFPYQLCLLLNKLVLLRSLTFMFLFSVRLVQDATQLFGFLAASFLEFLCGRRPCLDTLGLELLLETLKIEKVTDFIACGGELKS